LRGSDIDFNPVFFAYSLVTDNEVILYIDEKKITPQVHEHLGDSVQIKPYHSIFSHLRTLGKTNAAENKQVNKLIIIIIIIVL
jgi:Xaa-Pro aminopeptidase